MPLHKVSIRRTALALATFGVLHGTVLLAATTDSTAVPAVTATTNATSSDAGASNAKTMEAVSVVATGETRQIQKVTSEDIKALPPGSSPLKAIDKLPGVNFQAADPWGAYEWSTQITLHGFDQSRLGFTLDGIPLGTMSYGVINGLQITRAITSDNISTVELAQGAGEHVVGLGLGVGRAGRGHRRVAGVDHGLEGLALVGGVALHGLDQVRDQVDAPLQLHVDLGPRVVDAVARPDEAVVGDDEVDAQDHEDREHDDEDDHRASLCTRRMRHR